MVKVHSNSVNNEREVVKSEGELTISSGAITVTGRHHTVDTEGDVPSDYLDTINGGDEGEIVTLTGASDSRQVLARTADISGGNIKLKHDIVVESFPFSSPIGGSGTYYANGFYYAPVTDANLNQGAATVTLGTANIGYGAHAFLVAGGAGSVDAGSCSIVVSGTSLDTTGTRTPGDSETIVSDITAMSENAFYETSKPWIGQVVYTLTPSGATTYSADFNYGFSSYGFGGTHIHMELIKVQGRAGANDSGFDIKLLKHCDTGWDYDAAAFDPQATVLATWQDVYSTEHQLANGQPFGGRLSVGETFEVGEGAVVKVITTANNAVETMNFTVIYSAVPELIRIDATSSGTSFMKVGSYWIEL